MQKENALESEEGKVEEASGLSLRDALEVAIEAQKPDESGAKETDKGSSSTLSKDNGGSVTQSEQVPVSKDADKSLPKLEAPAEYTADERADFLQLSRKGQEAQLRLDKSRRSRVEEIKAASREFQEAKQLAETLNPYVKAMGIKEPTEVALKKAIKMWDEFERGNPKHMAAAYLRAKGLAVPKDLLEELGDTPQFEEKLKPLQTELDAIKQELAQARNQQAGALLQNVWSEFEQTKNAGGAAKYPDIGNTESGLKLAANIGSLVRGDTELSRQFIANVQARVPNLTYPALLEEAYRYCGGRIGDPGPETTKTQNAKEHIARAQRASASVPGRGTATDNKIGSTKKFKSYREAAAAALAQIKAE